MDLKALSKKFIKETEVFLEAYFKLKQTETEDLTRARIVRAIVNDEVWDEKTDPNFDIKDF